MPIRDWLHVIALGGLIASASAHAQTNDRAGVPVEAPSVEEQTPAEPEESQPKPPQLSIPVRIIEDPIEANRARDREAKSDQHEADDLEAQQRAAAAAERNAGAAERSALADERSATAAEGQIVPTWLQLVIALIGTAALIYTLWLTRRSVEAAIDAAQQAERQADIAEKSLSPFLAIGIAEEHIEGRLLREDGEAILQYFDEPYVEFHFRNYGRTPAIIKSIVAEFDDAERPPDVTEIAIRFAPTPDHIIEAEKQTRRFRTQPKRLTPEFKKRSELGFTYLWLYGMVEYEDMFGNGFVSEFCWQYDGPQDILAPYDDDRKRNRVYRKDKPPK